MACSTTSARIRLPLLRVFQLEDRSRALAACRSWSKFPRPQVCGTFLAAKNTRSDGRLALPAATGVLWRPQSEPTSCQDIWQLANESSMATGNGRPDWLVLAVPYSVFRFRAPARCSLASQLGGRAWWPAGHKIDGLASLRKVRRSIWLSWLDRRPVGHFCAVGRFGAEEEPDSNELRKNIKQLARDWSNFHVSPLIRWPLSSPVLVLFSARYDCQPTTTGTCVSG